VLSTSGESATC